MDKETARSRLVDLTEKYAQNVGALRPHSSGYNETELRRDYLDEFLSLLGWDVDNTRGAPQHLREVKQEESIEVDHKENVSRKHPDYTLRVQGERRLFVEAKKPSVRIEESPDAAYQVREYGWNAGLDVSLLSNFHHLAIYDCRYRPDEGASAEVARLSLLDYTQYVDHFDEIWDTLSRDFVLNGKHQLDGQEKFTGKRFDELFLEQIEEWRGTLAQNLLQLNPELSEDELNFLAQRLINRIVFLRICEDRDLETYERLRGVESYDELKGLFEEADERYNSGLFDFIDDQLSVGVNVAADVLTEIFEELYYPQSPYNFAVVDSGILGKIYDEFLGKQVQVQEGNATVEPKPEVVASGGVVPTPPYVSRNIVEETLSPLYEGESPDQLEDFRVCDMCCGSGSFLLAAYEELLNYHREWYIDNGPENHPGRILEGPGDQWKLTLHEKRRILLNSIHGVDLDQQAVEVARFSLLLKVLEDETSSAVQGYIEEYGEEALPSLKNNVKLGNSLIDSDYLESVGDTDEQIFERIQPFDWSEEFPHVFENGGFDAIVGNPPYIRIQNLVEHTPDEVAFYRSDDSPYATADQDNFDKYYLFVERALPLLNQEGRLGYITPHKFMSIEAGEPLRCLLSEGQHVRKITHFGVEQVFPDRMTYTAIMNLGRAESDTFEVERVDAIDDWRSGKSFPRREFDSDHIDCDPWVFISREAQDLFTRVREDDRNTQLQEVADIPVGLQTSADDIFIIQQGNNPTVTEADDGTKVIRFTKKGASWEIEREIARFALYDAILDPFRQPEGNAWMIFPYAVENGTAELYSEQEMQNRFPRTWKYLNHFKDQLDPEQDEVGRTSVRGGDEKWYQYGRRQSLTKFDGSEKLVWSTLATQTPYAYDGRGLVFTGGGNGPYYQLRSKEASKIDLPGAEQEYSIFYLLALLSDPVLESMVKVRGSDFRGGYYSHGKQFIETLPIRKIDFNDEEEKQLHDETANLSKSLVETLGDLEDASLPSKQRALKLQSQRLRHQIAERVASLYGFTKDDYLTVTEGSLLLSPPADEKKKLGSLPSFLLQHSDELDHLNLDDTTSN
jgi:type I restriction-modification system DNA methylase subunit